MITYKIQNNSRYNKIYYRNCIPACLTLRVEKLSNDILIYWYTDILIICNDIMVKKIFQDVPIWHVSWNEEFLSSKQDFRTDCRYILCIHSIAVILLVRWSSCSLVFTNQIGFVNVHATKPEKWIYVFLIRAVCGGKGEGLCVWHTATVSALSSIYWFFKVVSERWFLKNQIDDLST